MELFGLEKVYLSKLVKFKDYLVFSEKINEICNEIIIIAKNISITSKITAEYNFLRENNHLIKLKDYENRKIEVLEEKQKIKEKISINNIIERYESEDNEKIKDEVNNFYKEYSKIEFLYLMQLSDENYFYEKLNSKELKKEEIIKLVAEEIYIKKNRNSIKLFFDIIKIIMEKISKKILIEILIRNKIESTLKIGENINNEFNLIINSINIREYDDVISELKEYLKKEANKKIAITILSKSELKDNFFIYFKFIKIDIIKEQEIYYSSEKTKQEFDCGIIQEEDLIIVNHYVENQK